MKRALIRLCYHLALTCGVNQNALSAPRVQTTCAITKNRQHHVKIAKHFYS